MRGQKSNAGRGGRRVAISPRLPTRRGHGLPRHSRPSTYPSLPCKPRPTLSTTLPKRRSITPRARKPGPLKAVAMVETKEIKLVSLSSCVIASPITPSCLPPCGRSPPAISRFRPPSSLCKNALSPRNLSPQGTNLRGAAWTQTSEFFDSITRRLSPSAISPAGVRLAGALRKDEHCVGVWRVAPSFLP